MPESGRVGLHSRQFQGLLWSQALGAFNDNAFKTLIALTAVTLMPGGESARWIAMAGAAFILPFLFFSPLAGDLADKLPKKKLIVLFKGVEVALMALTLPALATKHLPALVGLLFLMGAHSAFFGPVKLAILPEMLKDEDLSHGNGLLQMSSFLGIILGTAAAGILAGHGGVWAAAGMFVAVAVIGLGCSLLIADPPAAAPDSVLRFNALARAWESLSEMRRFQPLWLAAVGSAYFWFLGAVLQMNLLVYGRELMGVGEGTLAGLQIVTALGIALGSYAAGRLSRGQVEPGLVPLGALMMVGFAWDLAFAFRSEARAAVDLFFLGAGGGFFMLPLSTFLQQRSPPARRGRFLAAANILSFAAILTASAALWSASTYFKLHAGQVFLVVSVMTAAVAAFVVAELPEYLVRLLTYPVANLIYRIEVEGRDAVPAKGPALLVANHVSFLDPAFIGAALPRPVRFIMFRTYYDLPVLHWFFKLMRCIPVSDKDGPKALLRSFEAARDALRAGEVLCLFGEGEITRHGQMQGFRKGLEWIVRDLPVPIVPVHLDRVWGSLFSFQGGRYPFKAATAVAVPCDREFRGADALLGVGA